MSVSLRRRRDYPFQMSHDYYTVMLFLNYNTNIWVPKYTMYLCRSQDKYIYVYSKIANQIRLMIN